MTFRKVPVRNAKAQNTPMTFVLLFIQRFVLKIKSSSWQVRSADVCLPETFVQADSLSRTSPPNMSQLHSARVGSCGKSS